MADSGQIEVFVQIDVPLQTGQFQTPVGRSLFGAFSDTAPDRWGRKLIERTEAASAREENRTARSFSEADYLLGARDDMRQGALRYRHPDGDALLASEVTGVPALLQLGALMIAAEALERDDPTSQQLRLLLRGGSSLRGARRAAGAEGCGRCGGENLHGVQNHRARRRCVAWCSSGMQIAHNLGPRGRLFTECRSG